MPNLIQCVFFRLWDQSPRIAPPLPVSAQSGPGIWRHSTSELHFRGPPQTHPRAHPEAHQSRKAQPNTVFEHCPKPRNPKSIDVFYIRACRMTLQRQGPRHFQMFQSPIIPQLRAISLNGKFTKPRFRTDTLSPKAQVLRAQSPRP